MADFNLKAIFEFVDKSLGGVKSAERNVSGLENVVGKATTALVAMGVAGAAKAAYHLAELGAQSIRTRNAFEAISGGAGEAAVRLDAMREATRGALSEQDMMASANKLMQMGLADSAGELERVTTMAVRLGTAMGRDASASIEEFSLLLANQSIPRLDTFGISAARVRTRIAELQSETKGMTREAAFMQAVMEEGSASMERLGDNTGDAALSFEQMEASVADLKAAFGEGLAPAISDVVGTLAPLVRTIGNVQKAWSSAREDMTTAERWTQLIPIIHYLDIGIRALAGGAEEAEVALIPLGPTLEELQGSASPAAESIDDLRITIHLATDAADGSTAAFRNADAALSGLVRPAEEAASAYERLIGDVGGLASALASFDVSAQSSWGMLTQLAEAGVLTADEVEHMAVQLGIATEEQVRATTIQRGLIAAREDGLITDTSLIVAMKALDKYTQEVTAATEAEKEGQDEAAEAHRDAAEAALQLADDMLSTAGAADEVRDAVDDASDAINDMPTEHQTDLILAGAEAFRNQITGIKSFLDSLHDKTVNVRMAYHSVGIDSTTMPGYASGTEYATGGMAMVGEFGPELVDLPRGSRVIPNSQVNNYNNYSRGGDTMIVQDSLSMAAIRETRYRQEMRDRGRMM